MADYSSPRPVDPIGYRRNAFLRISCGCGRRATYPLNAFAEIHRLPSNMPVYRLIQRLRCEMCGERPQHADIAYTP